MPHLSHPCHTGHAKVKQQQGQKMLIEKTLEKKDQMENKKRESIMVVRVISMDKACPRLWHICTSPFCNRVYEMETC